MRAPRSSDPEEHAITSGARNADAAALDAAWKIHAAVMDWTGKVDAKASFALTIESAGILATTSLSSQGRVFDKLTDAWRIATFWSAVALLVFSALAAISVVIPRLRRSSLASEWRTNYIYFGHLRMWTNEELTTALRTQDLLPVISTQIINMSKIAWKKHRRLQSSLILAVGATLLLLLTAVTA